MKGFIEVTEGSGIQIKNSIIPINKIKNIQTNDEHFVTVNMINGDYYLPNETKEEIKKLIKKAQ